MLERKNKVSRKAGFFLGRADSSQGLAAARSPAGMDIHWKSIQYRRVAINRSAERQKGGFFCLQGYAKINSVNDEEKGAGSMGLFRRSGTERKLRESFPYDPEKQIPVIKASICTGEKAAGFKDRKTGKFTEIMVINGEEDRELFMKAYGLDDISTIY